MELAGRAFHATARQGGAPIEDDGHHGAPVTNRRRTRTGGSITKLRVRPFTLSRRSRTHPSEITHLPPVTKTPLGHAPRHPVCALAGGPRRASWPRRNQCALPATVRRRSVSSWCASWEPPS